MASVKVGYEPKTEKIYSIAHSNIEWRIHHDYVTCCHFIHYKLQGIAESRNRVQLAFEPDSTSRNEQR